MYHQNSINLQHFLWLRELNIYPGVHHPVPSHFLYHEKNFYRSITPRVTVQDVNKPLGYMRKFTPDGRLLIAFSVDIKSVDVYRYKGVACAAELLRVLEYEAIKSVNESDQARHLRLCLFDLMFEKEFRIPLIRTPIISKNFLNREFSLFVENGSYVILASVAGNCIFPNIQNLQYPDLYDNIELYDYTIYLVDLKRGLIADTLKFDSDFMVLAYNGAASLYGRTLALFSAYRQCIELLEVNVKDGKFVRLLTLGPYGSDIDRDRILQHLQENNFTLDQEQAMPLTHMKQKFLAYIYRNIMVTNCLQERQTKLKGFYKTFHFLERAVISKMQLIDSDHLLYVYEFRPPLELEGNAFYNDIKLYVFYNFTEQKILKTYSQSSMELLNFLRNCTDEFRNVRSLQVPWSASSPSNNYILRSAFDQSFSSYSGGLDAAISRFNSIIPIPSQSFSTSPYLDFSLFKYEDKFISAVERSREIVMDPIHINDRKTGQLLYRVVTDEGRDSDFEDLEEALNAMNYVSYIFHPYEPFFISVQKFAKRHYVINFHMYSSTIKISKDDYNYCEELPYAVN